jgi:two-component system, chemotaxis family, response regulator Rcp1
LGYSSDCIQATNIPAPVSDWRFVGELWSATTGGSGSNPNQGKGPSSASPSRSEGPAIERPHILLAEDSKTDVFLIREALDIAQVDATIHVASDGLAATKFFDDADADEAAPCPALVLLDINLPRRNGDEVLRHLRRSRRCRDAKVLIVSSSDTARDRAAVADLSIVGYFKKPSDYAEFMKLGPLVKSFLAAPGEGPLR